MKDSLSLIAFSATQRKVARELAKLVGSGKGDSQEAIELARKVESR